MSEGARQERKTYIDWQGHGCILRLITCVLTPMQPAVSRSLQGRSAQIQTVTPAHTCEEESDAAQYDRLRPTEIQLLNARRYLQQGVDERRAIQCTSAQPIHLHRFAPEKRHQSVLPIEILVRQDGEQIVA